MQSTHPFRLVHPSVLSLRPHRADRRVSLRAEVYSCKSVSKERKLFKHLESIHSLEQAEMDEQLSLSPELRDAGLESCFGKLDQKDSRSAPPIPLPSPFYLPIQLF